MTLANYERGNCIKTEVDFKMNDVLTDPSGNVAFVDIVEPDGTYLVQDAATTRDGTGEYSYYFETTSTDPLGIYVVVWKGMHNLGGSYGYKNIVQRKAISIVYEND
jgi:hypothetical protein